jgi:predicted P-loop ATPase
MLQNDRQITISAANSRNATRWPLQTLYWSELVERLKTPARGTETLDAYLKLSKRQQDNLKDVGGYVGGAVHNGGRRKVNSIDGRDVLTLDLDHIPAGGTDDVLRRVDGLGCGYCIYSTRKHSPAAPRLRVLLPLDRIVTADEYEPIARKAAELIGIDMCDPTTFQVHRLMYWPSCCSDSQYVYTYGDKPFLSADGMLALYEDWHDVDAWPRVPGAPDEHKHLAAKQGDPTAKPGVVGAFCRTYNIYSAMDKFLAGVYIPVDNMPDRYTYAAGSTTGGAIVYDNGTFLYSHHATDPCSGRLVNAFDLVRLHKFSDLDDAAEPGTPTNRLPSYTEMCKLAVADPDVTALLNKERYQEATKDFAGTMPTNDTESENWMKGLQTSAMGAVLKTTKNIRLCLEHDPWLKGRIRLDTFSDRLVGIAPLPWGTRATTTGPFEWGEADDAGVRDYIQQVLNIKSVDLVADAVLLTAQTQAFNPVADYLKSLKWDGTPRLDTLYIDYLGAEDCPYIRAVTRKAFVAAITRAFEPGTKFDTMTVIEGPQGIGKTTLLARMGMQWFSNSLVTFEGKEAAELLQGAWIIEIGELEAYSKSDIRLVKQFLSKTEDQFRAAYARRTERHPRRCVFFGTTNGSEYLRDPTGNRRFWPVDATKGPHRLSVFDDLTSDIVAQIWAEAKVRYTLHESLILPKKLEEEAERRRAAHTERDPLQGQIEAFLDKPVPTDWQGWDASRRAMYWGGGSRTEIQTIPRDRVCAAEIWRECLGNRIPISKTDARRINEILSGLDGWEPAGLQRFGGEYGRQRGFKRKIGVNISLKSCQHSLEVVNMWKNMEVNNVNKKN